MQRYNGFANRTQFIATDLGDFPEIITKLFIENEGGRHLVIVRYGPEHISGNEWVFNSADLKHALDGMPVPLHPGAEKYYREVRLIK